MNKGKPKAGVLYSLTGGTGQASIASGNTWAESEVKEPNPPFPVEIIDTVATAVANPFTGETVTLQPTAIAVYDCIKGAEMLEKFDIVEQGIDWFRTHYPKEYFVLLD